MIGCVLRHLAASRHCVGVWEHVGCVLQEILHDVMASVCYISDRSGFPAGHLKIVEVWDE